MPSRSSLRLNLGVAKAVYGCRVSIWVVFLGKYASLSNHHPHYLHAGGIREKFFFLKLQQRGNHLMLLLLFSACKMARAVVVDKTTSASCYPQDYQERGRQGLEPWEP